jgi:hypothetical protein
VGRADYRSGGKRVGAPDQRHAADEDLLNGEALVRQKINVTGNGNTTLVAGRDLHVGERDTAAKEAPSPPDVILMAAADPIDLTRLQLGREAREIGEALRASAGRDRWKVELQPSVRLGDLCRALLEVQPRVVHFSGHGSASGGLFLEDEVGYARLVPPGALSELFAAVDGEVECVVLNACYSEPQAKAIFAHVPYVVGTTAEIADSAAITFSTGFYQALGAGRTIRQAFNVGSASVRASGETHPLVLLERS